MIGAKLLDSMSNTSETVTRMNNTDLSSHLNAVNDGSDVTGHKMEDYSRLAVQSLERRDLIGKVS